MVVVYAPSHISLTDHVDRYLVLGLINYGRTDPSSLDAGESKHSHVLICLDFEDLLRPF